MRSELVTFILFLTLAAPGQAAPAEPAVREPAVSMELTRTAHGDAMVSLAELMTEANVPKEARKLYEKALKADGKGDRARAREYALAAIELAPAFFQAHAALAVGHLQAGELEETDRELDIVASLNPRYLPAREIRGLVHFFRGDFREAVVALEALLKQAPCRDTARYFLTRSLLKLGDEPRARYHFEIAKILGRDRGRRGFRIPELGTGWDGASFRQRTNAIGPVGRGRPNP
jgi:tetratricopeptide (TPR) repeat protein